MISGRIYDNARVGACWISESGVQQVSSLVANDVPTASSSPSQQGSSVSISGDGNTVLMGGYGDNGKTGVVWLWKRTAGGSV